MADAVSKLYAEIGFKVDTKGLQEVKTLLQDLAKEATKFNKTAQQAAEKDNILSKKKIQQRHMSIKEQLKQNREQEKLFKEITDSEEREYKERLKQEEKFERERERRRKAILRNIKEFSKSAWNLSQLAFSSAAKMIGESIGRSSELSKLQMFTGISNKDYREFAERAFATNSGMSQEDVMRDIQNVSSNLSKIALGQGSLTGYKLAGVAAKGDVAGVIREFERAIMDGIAPNMALEVGQQIGLSRDWIYSMLENRRAGKSTINVSQEQRDEIVETGKAFRQVTFEVQNFKDYIVATLSPALQSGADTFRNALASLGRHFEKNSEFYSEKIKSMTESLDEFINNLKPEEVDEFTSNIISATKGIGEFVISLGSLLKIFTPSFWYNLGYDFVAEGLKKAAPPVDTKDPKEAWNNILFGKSAWDESVAPEKENRGGNVYSQANEINVTVESKTDNPYSEGREIGEGIKTATSEKLNFANNSTFVAGYNWG